MTRWFLTISLPGRWNTACPIETHGYQGLPPRTAAQENLPRDRTGQRSDAGSVSGVQLFLLALPAAAFPRAIVEPRRRQAATHRLHHEPARVRDAGAAGCRASAGPRRHRLLVERPW